MARSMKKTALREIKHTFGRFMAILAIIALGVGFFAGVRDTTPAMVNMMENFLKEKNFHDYRIISTSGWDDESVEEFSAQPDVLYAEGSISLDVIYNMPRRSLDEMVLKTHMFPDKINGIKLAEGTLPAAANECAAENDRGFKIGDKIKVHKSNNSETLEMLGESEYTVTALVDSSYYINHERGNTSLGNGTVYGFLYLPKEAFNTEYFTEVFIRFDNDYQMYSDEYDKFIENKNNSWETISEDIALKHHNSLMDEANAEISDAKAELEKNRAEGQAELDKSAMEIADGKNQLETSKSELDSAKADLDMLEAYIGKSSPEFKEAKAQYEQGLADYEKALADLEKGEKEYNDGLAEFNEKIADAEKEIADAEKKISDTKKPSVYLLDRNTNIGYALFENDSEIVEQVAKVFPIFFILVAALVCMTTMSRMVEEQRTQIGMFKALGYSETSIMGKFMFYSGSASLIGCILGFVGGTKLFPAIIWMTYKLLYIPLDIPYYFDAKLAAAAVAVSLLCSLGTTWISCRVELGETAASLMRPKSPKAGKRVFLEYVPFIWNRLKFLHKVSIRNIFRYKGRFFMMIIGIGGCMALLLTGFGLKDSIAGFADTQFDEIQIADSSVSFDSKKIDKIRTALDEKTEDYTMLRNESWDLLYGNRVKSIDLNAVESFDNMAEFMVFRDMNGSPLTYPEKNQAIVSHSISERYDVNFGDEITLRDADMRELKLKVTGVFENHTYNPIYITADTYESQLDEETALNKAFVNFPDDIDKTKRNAEINRISGIISVELFENTKNRMAEMMSSLDYIVLLVIACAAALAFIVIYNLTNINITERTREIATIKVLGFFRRETSAYVLRENLFLTTAGILAGIVMAIPLHSFVMSQIKVDIVDFSTVIFPISFLYSAILTFVFNIIVNLFMEIKLEKINMAESLKSVD
ncbi:MAG: ABC transporter permease [Ruminococcus sp.]|nr:ABC transporter permease [Ruminococcus sp.]